MPQHADDLQTREMHFGTNLDARYSGLWPMTDAVLHWSSQVFAACPPKQVAGLPESELVGRTLMARIITDIYALSTLAWRGYIVQTASLAASTFETCVYLSYVGLNDDRAKKWLNHKDHTKAFLPVYAAVEGTLINEISGQVTREVLEQAIADEYRIYGQLCAVKHGHAVVQMPLGVQWGELGAEVHVGPQLTPEAQEVTLGVMWHVLRQVLSAADTFARAHLPEAELRRLKPQLEDLNTQMLALSVFLPTNTALPAS